MSNLYRNYRMSLFECEPWERQKRQKARENAAQARVVPWPVAQPVSTPTPSPSFPDQLLYALAVRLLSTEPPVVPVPAAITPVSKPYGLPEEPEPELPWKRLDSEIRSDAVRLGKKSRSLDKEGKKKVIALVKSSMRAPAGRRKSPDVKEALWMFDMEGKSFQEIFVSVLGPQQRYKYASQKEKKRLERLLRHRVLAVLKTERHW